MKIKVSLGQRIFTVFNYIFISLLVLLCFYPFWHVLTASFSDANLLFKHTGLLLKPLGFTLEAYKVVLEQELLISGYINIFFLLIVGIPLDLVITALGAYFFSRNDVYFKKPLFTFCLLTMYISGGMIPFYLNMRDLHLTNTLWGIVLAFCLSAYNMIILRTAFASVPESLCDAARIDGAGHITTLFRVVLPLSKASVAVIALYYGMSIWNGWFWSSTLISDQKKWPLQAVLRKLLIEDTSVAGGGNMMNVETVRYAIIIVSIIPVLLVYPLLQKHFTKGVLVGAVKG